MPDLAECIRRYHEAQATRDPSRPVRVIRVAMLRTKNWRAAADRGWGGRRQREIAATGEHLGLDRVGLLFRKDHG